MAGAEVRLCLYRAPSTRNDATEAQAEWIEGFRKAADARTTRGDGTFAFCGAPAALYNVIAMENDAVRVAMSAVRLELGRTTEVELELPPAVRVTGRVVAPIGALFERVRIRLRPLKLVGELSLLGSFVESPCVEAELDESGRFRMDRVPPGAVRASLVVPGNSVFDPVSGTGYGTAPEAIDLGEAFIPAIGGDIAVDALETFPGMFRVSIRDMHSIRTDLVLLGEHITSRSDRSSSFARNLPEKLPALMGPVRPGEWRVRIETTRTNRVAPVYASETVDMRPGGVAEIVLDARLLPPSVKRIRLLPCLSLRTRFSSTRKSIRRCCSRCIQLANRAMTNAIGLKLVGRAMGRRRVAALGGTVYGSRRSSFRTPQGRAR